MSRHTSRARARIAKVRLPPDLAAAVDAFATRARAAHPDLNTSGVFRMLLRAGLAADAAVPLDLRGAGFSEGWMQGHGEAVHAHQRALRAAQDDLGS